MAKALAFVPDIVTLVTERLLLPLLDRVTPIAAEVVAVGVFGNAIAEVESVAVGGKIAVPFEPDAHPVSNKRTPVDTASPEMR
jgi:hypothetical protein